MPLKKRFAAILTPFVLAIAIASCGGGGVSSASIYDPSYGITYGYACNQMGVDPACQALYGSTYFTTHPHRYSSLTPQYVSSYERSHPALASQVNRYRVKTAAAKAKARVEAVKAKAKARTSSASKPKVSFTKSSTRSTRR